MSKGDPFYYHRPGPGTNEKLEDCRRRFRELRNHLLWLGYAEGAAGRERSLAITHLQEAMNHAICGLVLSDENAEPLE